MVKLYLWLSLPTLNNYQTFKKEFAEWLSKDKISDEEAMGRLLEAYGFKPTEN